MNIKPEITIEVPYLTSVHLAKFMGISHPKVNKLVEELAGRCEILLPPSAYAHPSILDRGAVCYVFYGQAGYAAGLALAEHSVPARKVTVVKHVSRLVETQVGAEDYAEALEAAADIPSFTSNTHGFHILVDDLKLAEVLRTNVNAVQSWLRRVGIQRAAAPEDLLTAKGSEYGYQRSPSSSIEYRQESVVELYKARKLWAPRLIGPPPTSFKAFVSGGGQ